MSDAKEQSVEEAIRRATPEVRELRAELEDVREALKELDAAVQALEGTPVAYGLAMRLGAAHRRAVAALKRRTAEPPQELL